MSYGNLMAIMSWWGRCKMRCQPDVSAAVYSMLASAGAY